MQPIPKTGVQTCAGGTAWDGRVRYARGPKLAPRPSIAGARVPVEPGQGSGPGRWLVGARTGRGGDGCFQQIID